MSAPNGDASRRADESAGGAATRAERAYRRALLAYPRRYRRERGEELVSTLLDAADARARAGGVGRALPPLGTSWVELGELVGEGLRRRLRSDHPWWDGVRCGAALIIGFVVLSSTTSILAVATLPGPGFLLPNRETWVGWWFAGPLGTTVVGVPLLIAVLRRWTFTAWLLTALVLGARLAQLAQGNNWGAWPAIALTLLWVVAPVTLTVQGRRWEPTSWRTTAVAVALPLAFGLWPPQLPDAVLVLVASVLAVAAVSPTAARGLAVAALLVDVWQVAYEPHWIGPGAAPVVAIVAAAWAECLDRVVRPRTRRTTGGFVRG